MITLRDSLDRDPIVVDLEKLTVVTGVTLDPKTLKLEVETKEVEVLTRHVK